jgi:hypothetical protein
MGELARTWWFVHESDGLYIAETSADQGEWRMTPTNWTAIHKIRLEALSTFAQLQYVVTEAVAFPLAVAAWPGMIVSRWLRKRACDGAGVNVLSYSLWPRRRRLFPVITHAAPHDQASASHVLMWPWALLSALGFARSARCGSLLSSVRACSD